MNNWRADRRLHLLAAAAFALAAVVLWLPLSWERAPNLPGAPSHLDFGVLKPLRATWQSSAEGFWFAFTDVRIVALALSVVLTVAAIRAARESYRRYGGAATAEACG